MPVDVTALEQQARGRYETARLRRASLFSVPLAAVAAYNLFCTTQPTLALGCGLLVVVSATAFLWRGQAWGAAVLPASVASLAPLVLPTAMGALGHACFGHVCWSGCVTGCLAAGVAAGVVVGLRAARRPEGRVAFLAAAGTIVALAGAPACAFAGVPGILGLLAGFVAGAPIVLAAATPAEP